MAKRRYFTSTLARAARPEATSVTRNCHVPAGSFSASSIPTSVAALLGEHVPGVVADRFAL